MSTTETIETQAVSVLPPVEQNLPSDAKNKAISDLTAECYKRASQLALTKDEVGALSADFPDEAFQPGAAGKENLIYIEHAALRERLDQVIGMGQWCVIPIRRWEEKFTYQKDEWLNNRRTGNQIDVTGSHVYVDGIMLIRGAFVGSAIGEMTYYPDNHTQNYGDAVEGAETAALRRCCKRLGIGLQAWRKDWCLGWWDRRNASKKRPVGQSATLSRPANQNAPQGQETLPKATPASSTVEATPKFRLKALNRLQGGPGQPKRDVCRGWLMVKGWIVAGQEPEEWTLSTVPTNEHQMATVWTEFDEYSRHMAEFNNEVVP